MAFIFFNEEYFKANSRKTPVFKSNYIKLKPKKCAQTVHFLNKKGFQFPESLVILVIATGFEPVTVCLEGRCSIQLSYATIVAFTISKPPA